MQTHSLAHKTAVITGSSQGIGRAIALRMAAAGADVIVHGNLHLDESEDVAEKIRKLGRRSTVMPGDLEQDTRCDALVDAAWKWQGAVDIWVNNAGADVLTGAAADGSFQEKLHKLWRVDVNATIGLSRRIGARMKKAGGGVILNMGWDRAMLGMSGESGQMFAAVKGAVMAFTKSLAQSLAPEVRVNCLAPGWIKTAWGDDASNYWQARAARESLRDRWGTPEDVANVACFLASSDADFVNGQIVPVNGGFRCIADS